MKKIFWKLFSYKWCRHCHAMTRHHWLLNKIFKLPGSDCARCGQNRVFDNYMKEVQTETGRKIKIIFEHMKETNRKIRNEYHEAMEFADIADSHQRKGEMEEAMENYKIAYGMTRWCAENISKEIEPSRSIIYSSAMLLANSAGLKNEAIELAEKLLSFTQYEEYRDGGTKLLAELKNI